MAPKNKKTRRRNRINKTEQANLQKLKEVGKKLKPKIKSAANKVSKFAKKNAPTAKKQALKIGKGILKKGKGLVKGTITSVKGGVTGLGAIAGEKAINQVVDRGFRRFANKGKDKDMSLKDYRAKVKKTVKEANKNKGLNRIPNLLKTALKIKPKSNRPSSNRPNPKQGELDQINKNIKNARGWNKEQLIKKKKHLEKFGKSKTWSNAYGAEGGGKPSTGDTLKSKTKKKRLTAREKLVAKNVARHGQAHVDKLKAKNVDFKKMRRKEMSKDEFIKKYPKSITAQKAQGLRK